jgi:sulfur carrier protein
MMNVFVNGETRELAASTTVMELLSVMELVGKRIAVELNREIISRNHFAATLLREGDCVEIVHAIGGG